LSWSLPWSLPWPLSWSLPWPLSWPLSWSLLGRARRRGFHKFYESACMEAPNARDFDV